MNYEDCYDLFSTIEVKDERKRAAAQIKNIASARAAYLSDRKKSVRIPRKNKEMNGVPRSNKPQKKFHNHHSIQRYFVLCSKSGMPEQNYMLHSADDFTVVRTYQTIKDGMGRSVGSRADTVRQYKKYEKSGIKS